MNELVYRAVALALMAAYIVIRTAFERRLNRSAKQAQSENADARNRLELGVVGYGQLPHWFYVLSTLLQFAALGLPGWVRWLGAAVTALGLVGFVWTHRELAGNWSPCVEPARAGSLVTTGPYRWVRHPMYTSFFLYYIGLALLMSNWVASLLPLATFVWMYANRVRREEVVMLEQFGDVYRAYAEKTGRLVPRFGRRAAF